MAFLALALLLLWHEENPIHAQMPCRPFYYPAQERIWVLVTHAPFGSNYIMHTAVLAPGRRPDQRGTDGLKEELESQQLLAS